ncbi:MAG: hypothetical protein GY953_44610 [bacterium]|nr:hypothetical protein [bacterium]
METTASKEHAHKLIERLDAEHLRTVVDFLEFLLVDPVSRALATAPIDDEPETEDEKQAVAEARDWLTDNGGKGIPHDEAMSKLGLK